MLDVEPELVQQGPRIWLAIAWGIGLGIALVILMMLGIILDHYGLFPRRLFAWIDAAFSWISDDPLTRRLQFYFITIVVRSRNRPVFNDFPEGKRPMLAGVVLRDGKTRTFRVRRAQMSQTPAAKISLSRPVRFDPAQG